MYRKQGVSLNLKKDIKTLLAVARKSREYHWLKQYDSIALQQSVINLHTAFDRIFNPKLSAKYPRFKRRHGKQSSYHCVGVKVIDGAIKLPKMQPVKANIHREISSILKSITVSLNKTGKFYASILVDDGIVTLELLHIVATVTCIDLGLSHFTIHSNGKKE